MPTSDRPAEVTKGPGDFLAAAVLEFEALFEAVDDYHMHDGGSRTTQGARFVNITVGTSDNTMPVPYQDHEACARDWLVAAKKLAPKGGKVLLWKVQPHLLNLDSGLGFTIVSRFAIEDEVTKTDAGDARETRKPAPFEKAVAADPAEPEIKA